MPRTDDERAALLAIATGPEFRPHDELLAEGVDLLVLAELAARGLAVVIEGDPVTGGLLPKGRVWTLTPLGAYRIGRRLVEEVDGVPRWAGVETTTRGVWRDPGQGVHIPNAQRTRRVGDKVWRWLEVEASLREEDRRRRAAMAKERLRRLLAKTLKRPKSMKRKTTRRRERPAA